MERASGVLLPIFSLPSKYGIGCFSKEAYQFIDRLKAAGQSYWQILPLGPTGYGDSPYQSFSTFAGNPYFIDLETLTGEGLLTAQECEYGCEGIREDKIDYEKIYKTRFQILEKAFSRFGENDEYRAFVSENQFWLEDYSLYMAIKDRNGGVSWNEWEEPLKNKESQAIENAKAELSRQIAFYKFQQYEFDRQWKRLRSYANENGIVIIGDIPIYVAFDSADTWSAPEMFRFNDALEPIDVAGCPPDGFSQTGQLWGNPLYDWEYHKKTGYDWWIRRIEHCFRLYDVVRIDHFRGFDEYYAIPYGDKTAERGWWEKGPGMDLFRTVSQRLGQKDIIAEDLGFMTDSVKRLVEESGYPNMKVIEFAFDARDTGNASDYLPHNYTNNCVVYTGTHDNETLLGWYSDITPEERHMVREYLWNFHDDEKGICRNMIRLVMGSAAGRCIIPIQDYLQLDNTARINQPSTLGINWKWRLTEGQFTKELQKEMLALATRFGRRNWTPDPVEEEDEEKEEA